MPVEKIGPYRVERQLGSGGMGEVFLAYDDRLRRHVAIKQLRPDKTSPDLRERFRREAQAVAILCHSSIVQVFDLVEQDGIDHLVMEFVEGKPLSALIAGGPLPAPKVVRLAKDVCSGLAEAHSKGIVHRDLKSENIMVTRAGQAKILDFGLAKQLAEPDAGLSVVGAVVGTYRSMSPEQAQGHQVDHRTDLFSFGVLLYEAATGKSPFQGPSALATLAKLVTQRQIPARSLEPEIGEELSGLIDWLLEKTPERRPQDAAAIGAVLERFGEVYPQTSTSTSTSFFRGFSSSAALPLPLTHSDDATKVFNPFVSSSTHTTVSYTLRSIAVLPFVNRSADEENEYFSDGLTEDLTQVLSQIPGLKVASRTSAFSFKGKNLTVQEIGRALGVESVLEGSVRKAGQRLRISAQVTSAGDGHQLWSERYDRDLTDVFALQDEIARTIAEALKIKLGRLEHLPIAKRATPDVEAYNLYLKGRYHWNRRFAGGLQKGMEHFRQAIAADPKFALPHSGLADSFAILAFYNYIPPHLGFSQALAAARQALALDPDLSEAHACVAWVTSFFVWDWKAAENEFQRAIGLNPNWGTAYSWYSFHLHALGHSEASWRAIEKAFQIEPLSVSISGALSFNCYLHGEYDRGAQVARDALEIDANFAAGFSFLGFNLMGQKAWPEAIEAFETAIRMMGGLSLVKGLLGYCYAKSGQEEKARQVLDELLETGKTAYVSTFFVAWLQFGLGEIDACFEWLDKSFEERNNWLAFLEVLPTLEPLRSDPRFASLSARIGLDQYHRR